MPRNLQKQAAKQQARIAALNTLGTPVSSRPGSDVEEDWETASDTSTVDSIAMLDEVSLSDEVRRCVDDLGEKRASVRETALAKLNRLLAHHYCGTFFAENASSQEALLQLLSRSLRKPGSAKEAQLAARGIALAFANQAELSSSEQEGLYGMVLSLLKSTIVHSLDSELKYQSIETLSFITFIAASQADTKGGLEYFYNILASEGEDLQPEELEEDKRLSSADIDRLIEACIRAYGLLYASLYGDTRGTWEDAWDESQSVMPVHLELLQSKATQTRISAGENVALMFDCVKTLKDEAEDEDENGATPEYVEMDELKDALQRLSTDSNKRVNKQDRKEQRTAFRDINRSVENGDRPKHRLKIGGTLLHFRGWAQQVELAAFRNFLGPGLARHLQENELLQAVFAGTQEESSESGGEELEEETVGTAFGFEGEDEDLMLSAQSAAGKRDRARRLKMSKGR